MVVLDRCLVVYLCDDDFALFGVFLLACENEVPVEDACIDHGVALDTEGEHVATAGEKIAVDGDCAFEVLHGENRRTGGHAADDGNFYCIARCLVFRSICIGRENFDSSAEARRAVDVALLDEGGEDEAYTVRRRNLEMVPDFAHGRRHVVLFGVLLDVFQDFFLTACQFLFLCVIHL